MLPQPTQSRPPSPAIRAAVQYCGRFVLTNIMAWAELHSLRLCREKRTQVLKSPGLSSKSRQSGDGDGDRPRTCQAGEIRRYRARLVTVTNVSARQVMTNLQQQGQNFVEAGEAVVRRKTRCDPQSIGAGPIPARAAIPNAS